MAELTKKRLMTKQKRSAAAKQTKAEISAMRAKEQGAQNMFDKQKVEHEREQEQKRAYVW